MTFSSPRMKSRRGTRTAWVAASTFLLSAVATSDRSAMGFDDQAPAKETVSALRDGFESPRIVWNEEQTDATITPIVHDRTNRAAHEGETSERISFKAGIGSSLFYSYELPKVPVGNSLQIELFMRANRPGAQLFARVVLPADVDPETKEPSYLLLPGTFYENANHWQRLELSDPQTAIERQIRVLRATTKRPVSLEGAYVEQVVVNLYSGAGETEVFLDDLTVSPVPAESLKAMADDSERLKDGPAPKPEIANVPPSTSPSRPAAVAPKGANPLYRLDRNLLKKRGEDGLYYDSVFSAIHAPGADLTLLRQFGFDVLIDTIDSDPKRFEEAVARGFALMPVLGRDSEGNLPDPDQVDAVVKAFPYRESIMAWCLGDRLGRASSPVARREELERARAIVAKIKGLPAGVSRLTTGTVDDDIARYARAPRNLDMMGIRPSAWGSSLAPMSTLQFLKQRRNLSVKNNAGALYWAVLPATPPPSVNQAIWGNDPPPAGMDPAIQPEQLRMMTYAALSAGYRGIAFRGNASLTGDSGPGRMLLLEMSMLNAEIDLCESIIANGNDPIPQYFTYPPDPPTIPPQAGNRNQRVQVVKEYNPLPGLLAHGIGLSERRGVLLFVSDYGGGAQFQPGQMAMNDVKLTVIAPESAQGFEISPGRFRVLEREPGIGGVRFTLPEFDGTALVLVTSDVDMALRVESVVKSIRPSAAQMAIEQAQIKLNWVTEISGRLAAEGHPLITDKIRKERGQTGGPLSTDLADLLQAAAKNVEVARENLLREDYSNAWSEARRASRALRIVMRGFWQNALTDMTLANTPPEDIANEVNIEAGRALPAGPLTLIPEVASAPLVSFNTLPQHYVWVDSMRNGYFGANLVPTGSFDDTQGLEQAGWSNQSYEYEGIISKVSTVPNKAKGTRRSLKMSVDAIDEKNLDKLPPFLDFPAAAIRTPPVAVKAGQFLKISVYVQRPTSTSGGAGGVVIRDSIGGEALQFVSTGSFPSMTRVVLYRRVPADGEMSVLLGLAGYHDVYFDDLSIQRIETAPNAAYPENMVRAPALAVPANIPLPPAPTARRRPGNATAPATANAPGRRLGGRANR